MAGGCLKSLQVMKSLRERKPPLELNYPDNHGSKAATVSPNLYNDSMNRLMRAKQSSGKEARTHLRVLRWLLLGALSLFASIAFAQTTPQDLPPVDSVFKLQTDTGDAQTIRLHWSIEPGYYLYRHQFKFSTTAAGVTLGAAKIPPGEKHHDEFFGDVETYRNQVSVSIPVTAPAGTQAIALRVKYQGCADVGVCYPPQIRNITASLARAVEPQGDAGFKALAGKFGGNAAPLPLGGGKSAPLPPMQAFKAEAIADGGDRLLIRFTPAPGYYLYKNQTKFKLKAEGVSLGEVQWPKATMHRDEHFGNVPVYFNEIDVPVLLKRSHARAVSAELQIELQGCQNDGICYEPMQRSFQISLPASGVKTQAKADETTVEPVAALPDAVTASAAAPVAVENTAASAAEATTQARPMQSPANTVPAQDISLWKALLLALLGGLILNLMPCVLPVLSMKAVSITQGGNDLPSMRRHIFAYAAGVILSMLLLGGIVLSLRGLASQGALAWGFQMQQPAVVAVLGLFVLAFGLSLSGLWQANFVLPGAAQRAVTAQGLKGDFATGVLAVLLATPCTAPFMGAALGYAFFAPTLQAALVFVALGFGLALPFLLIAWIPALGRMIPKPGAWTDTFKKLMALPMYATVAWLVWLLFQLRGWPAVLMFMVAVIALIWVLRDSRQWHASPQRRWWPRIALAVLVAAMAFAIHTRTSSSPRLPAGQAHVLPNGLQAEPYSAERLLALRTAGKVVFVDVTADWCITCKVNERAVLFTPGFKAMFEQYDAVYMIADNTEPDEAIAAFLQTHKAVGLPLYVVYPANGGNGQVLPTVLTQRMVADALAVAAHR